MSNEMNDQRIMSKEVIDHKLLNSEPFSPVFDDRIRQFTVIKFGDFGYVRQDYSGGTNKFIVVKSETNATVFKNSEEAEGYISQIEESLKDSLWSVEHQKVSWMTDVFKVVKTAYPIDTETHHLKLYKPMESK